MSELSGKEANRFGEKMLKMTEEKPLSEQIDSRNYKDIPRHLVAHAVDLSIKDIENIDFDDCNNVVEAKVLDVLKKRFGDLK